MTDNEPFSIRLESKKGQFVVKNLSSNTTIADLKTRVAAMIQVQESQFDILAGHPPRPIDLITSEGSLASIGINSGETLIVLEKSPTVSDENLPLPENDRDLALRLRVEEDEEHIREIVAELSREYVPPAQSRVELPSGSNSNFNGTLLRKRVPADNSCLFSSIRFVLNDNSGGNESLRRIIAREVAADPEEFSDAVLGKPNAKYCAWIQKPDSWGGAIEIKILSNYYGIEIDVVDIQNGIINRFGEDKNYNLRVFLLFDGVHYDPLYMETEIEDTPATIFPVEEMAIYRQAEQLATESKLARRSTFVAIKSMRCLQCDVVLQGQAAAHQHAKETGHTDYAEV